MCNIDFYGGNGDEKENITIGLSGVAWRRELPLLISDPSIRQNHILVQ